MAGPRTLEGAGVRPREEDGHGAALCVCLRLGGATAYARRDAAIWAGAGRVTRADGRHRHPGPDRRGGARAARGLPPTTWWWSAAGASAWSSSWSSARLRGPRRQLDRAAGGRPGRLVRAGAGTGRRRVAGGRRDRRNGPRRGRPGARVRARRPGRARLVVVAAAQLPGFYAWEPGSWTAGPGSRDRLTERWPVARRSPLRWGRRRRVPRWRSWAPDPDRLLPTPAPSQPVRCHQPHAHHAPSSPHNPKLTHTPPPPHPPT